MNIAHRQNAKDQLLIQRKEAELAVQALSGKVLAHLSPKPGPHRFFHYSADVLTRIREVSLLFERLYDTRLQLFRADTALHNDLPRDWPGGVPYPEAIQTLMKETSKLELDMSVDFQSMLIFSAMMLDEIAQMAAHVVGRKNPYRIGFDELAKTDGKAPFDVLWLEFRTDILWLDAIPRLFRNKMMVHREQPWQVGTTRSVFGFDWSFWIPVAASWYTPEEQETFLAELRALLAKAGLQLTTPHLHDAVFLGLNNIAMFEAEDRAVLRGYGATLGFATPTFQVFGKRLFAFTTAFMNALAVQVDAHPERVDVGSRQ